jgi:hypothetical protein
VNWLAASLAHDLTILTAAHGYTDLAFRFSLKEQAERIMMADNKEQRPGMGSGMEPSHAEADLG